MQQAITTRRSLIRKEMYFRLAELANAASEQSEKERYRPTDPSLNTITDLSFNFSFLKYFDARSVHVYARTV